jgi:hypothetical protein
MSMKKIKNFEAEANQIIATLDALEKLFLDISSEDVELDGHEHKVKEILAVPITPVEKISDVEMLKELNRLTILGAGESEAKGGVKLDGHEKKVEEMLPLSITPAKNISDVEMVKELNLITI